MGLLIRRPISEQTVWLHVDRLDREDGRVWAVQWHTKGRSHYKAVHEVSTLSDGQTVRFGAAGPKQPWHRQPRAVIEFRPATVRVKRHGAYWRAVIFTKPSRTTSSAIVVKGRARV
jgi:hypothetical protein